MLHSRQWLSGEICLRFPASSSQSYDGSSRLVRTPPGADEASSRQTLTSADHSSPINMLFCFESAMLLEDEEPLGPLLGKFPPELLRLVLAHLTPFERALLRARAALLQGVRGERPRTSGSASWRSTADREEEGDGGVAVNVRVDEAGGWARREGFARKYGRGGTQTNPTPL